MNIDLIAEDWSIMMGLVGLKRLFSKEVKSTDFGVSFDSSILEQIPERYFYYLLNEYSISNRDKDYLNKELEQAKKRPDQFGDIRKNIINRMSEQFKKVTKYFPETKGLDNIVENVKEIKSIDEIDKLQKYIDEFIKITSQTHINEKLTLNYAKSVVLYPLFGQVSFLNVANYGKTIKEQLDIMRKDYIEPALLEIDWVKLLNSGADLQAVIDFLEEKEDYPPFKSWLKKIKKCKTENEMYEYIQQEISHCLLIENMPGTYTYEEMVFSPLGTSVKNSMNFYWNLNKDEPVPISALGRLLMFLIPIGSVVYTRKQGFGNQAEYLSFYGFIFFQDKFEVIYQKNNNYKIQRTLGNPFEDIIIDLLKDNQEKAMMKDQSFLILEFYSDYKSKKTLLDYYHMPAYSVTYFKEYANMLKWIDRYEYREAYIRDILKGIDPKQVIFRYLLDIVHQGRSGYGAFIATKERFRILNLKKGVEDAKMKEKEKPVFHAFFEGKKLRKAILVDSNARMETAEKQYVASGNKKIQGIAYRLLNSVKAGQRQQFLDTVFRLHLGVGQDIPPILLNVLHEKDLDFETVATAFITGLLTNENQEKDKKEGAVAQ